MTGPTAGNATPNPGQATEWLSQVVRASSARLDLDAQLILDLSVIADEWVVTRERALTLGHAGEAAAYGRCAAALRARLVRHSEDVAAAVPAPGALHDPACTAARAEVDT
jgi:hypothetical protein